MGREAGSSRACLQTPKVISINRFRQDRSITAKPQTRVGGRAQMVKSGRFCPRAIVCKHALVLQLQINDSALPPARQRWV